MILKGYKVYRTTDVSFEEIRSITDGRGGKTLQPEAIYDKKMEYLDFTLFQKMVCSLIWVLTLAFGEFMKILQ